MAPLALLWATLAGCASSGPVGDTGLTAEYRIDTLRLRLDDPLDPAVVGAAAEASFRDLGLTVTERDVTSRRARLVARAPSDDGAFDAMVVTARREGAGTEISVVCRPLGDETHSYALMDAMMVRLGR